MCAIDTPRSCGSNHRLFIVIRDLLPDLAPLFMPSLLSQSGYCLAEWMRLVLAVPTVVTLLELDG